MSLLVSLVFKTVRIWAVRWLSCLPLLLQVVVASSREFWVAKAVEAWVSHERVAFFDSAERALLLGFPHGFEAGVFAAAVAAAARVRVLAGKVCGRRLVGKAIGCTTLCAPTTWRSVILYVGRFNI